MSQTTLALATDNGQPVSGAFKVDPSKGTRIGEVSSQWAARPIDQRYLSLDSLAAQVRARRDSSQQRVIAATDIEVITDPRDSESLALGFNGVETYPTNYTFGQLAGLAGAPAGYLRKLPATLAGINLQYGLQSLREENVKAYWNDSTGELMAATGANYGRIFDIELVEAVQRIAGNGTGDTRWKVPGLLNWQDGTYNPYVDITTQTTTLYASDRDVFMFLVDDTHPIEIGKLANGEPDLVFRGFYAWNSEVGSKTLGISTFLLRGVCQNRNIWGAQDINSFTLRHSGGAPARFVTEAAPALLEYANASDKGIIAGINAAKQAVVAKDDESRLEFLGKHGFTLKQAHKVIDQHELEEGRKPSSVWDFVQGITATARSVKFTDDRVALEERAGKMLEKAAKRAA